MRRPVGLVVGWLYSAQLFENTKLRKETRHVSLGLQPEPSRYVSSPVFNDAVNDAQFVRTFGIIALVGSLLILIGGAIAIGLGLAVMGFGHGRYFKVVGATVLILGVASVFIKVLGVIGALVLALGVLWKAVEVLRVLGQEGRDDPDWGQTHRRAIAGLVCSGIGALVSLGWALLVALAVAAQLVTHRG